MDMLPAILQASCFLSVCDPKPSQAAQYNESEKETALGLEKFTCLQGPAHQAVEICRSSRCCTLPSCYW